MKSLKEILRTKRLRKTVLHVQAHLKMQPAVGTTPSFAGWPEIRYEDLEELQFMLGADIIGIPCSLPTDTRREIVAITYGLNPQAAWTVHLNNCDKMVEGKVIDPSNMEEINNAIKKKIERDYGVVLTR